ncbi:MAG: hypothetical protein HPY66_0730 [Firmicutes bacterium]|nr:hypothetical protein [Bacillota bacterium]MDI6705663.1 SIMPL domain-containing protein [Bacillota bacterium]
MLRVDKAKLAASVLLVVCLVLAAYLVKDVFASEGLAADEGLKNIITVSGTGIVMVKPDIAYIRVGVETRGADAKKAQQENAQIMDKIASKLKSLGVKDDDIKTVTYNLYPVERYDDKTNKSYVYEYRVNNIAEVVVRDIDKTGAVIDGVASVGSNKISSIRFGIEDTEKYYREALNMAVINASGKAEAIAEGLGVKIKGAVNVQEVSSGGPIVYRQDMALAKLAESYDQAATPISAGELEISAMVSVQYSY